MEETYFDDAGCMKRRSIEHLNSIPEEDFQESFEVWKSRMEAYITANGDYFERTKV
jgi:hypothetical protein